MTSEQNVSKSNNQFKTALYLVLLAIGIWLIVELRSLLLTLVFALTLSSAIAPLAEALEKKKVPRLATIIGVYICVGLVYSFAAVSLFPPLKEQTINLIQHVPGYLSGLNDWYDKIRGLLGDTTVTGSTHLETPDFGTLATKIGRQTLDVTSNVVGCVVNGIVVLFLTAYFVIEAEQIWSKLLLWLPANWRPRAASLIKPLEGRLGGYVRGQLLVSLAVAFVLGTGLTLLGVKYSLVLGVMAGLLNLVPFVGSILTAVFATLVAANQSLTLGGCVVLLFGFEQWLESNVIVPQLLGKQVELHPLIVLFSILIGATVLGLAGAIVAVPLATAIVYLAQEFYFYRINPRDESPGTFHPEPGKRPEQAEKTESATISSSQSEARIEGPKESVIPAVTSIKPDVQPEKQPAAENAKTDKKVPEKKEADKKEPEKGS